jgi:hypothetical protein
VGMQDILVVVGMVLEQDIQQLDMALVQGI